MDSFSTRMFAIIEKHFIVKLSCILVYGVTGALFACSSLFAADNQSTQTVVVATNVSKLMLQPPQPLDTAFVWDSVTKTLMAASNVSTAQFTFKFSNVSSNTVTILSVEPSCSCTTAQLPPLPWTIAPGGKGQIGVTVNLAGKSGKLIKSVLVTTDRGSKRLLFMIMIRSRIMEGMTDAGRARNLAVAQIDKQAVFRNDCASCHAKPAVGKFGEKLYDVACGICHEGENRATMVPDLHKISQPTNVEFWRAWIEHGKPGTLMPAFSITEGGPLTDTQIKSLANYLAKTIPSK
jgi:mono/diheme cytochrome c family protein